MLNSGIHPLYYLGDNEIEVAYTLAKAAHILIGVGAVAGGIVIIAATGAIAGGVAMIVLGPVLTLINWIFARLVFMHIRNVHDIRRTLGVMQSESQSNKEEPEAQKIDTPEEAKQEIGRAHV